MSMIFVENIVRNPEFFWSVTLSVIPSICLHEYAHAQTALWCGDFTAAESGHLTLNPLKQMGIFSMVMFLLLGVAWGAVPVTPSRLTKRGRVMTSFAGPCTNLILFALAWTAFPFIATAPALPKLLAYYVLILGVFNFVLFILNMLPVPGLDGWGVLSEFVKFGNVNSEFVKGAMVLMIFLLFFFFEKLYDLAGTVMGYSRILLRITGME